MTKPKSKPRAVTRSAARKTSKSKSRARSVALSPKAAARPNTKHARIIAMLRAPAGRDACFHHNRDRMAASFRARFLAGVVRKKLGLNLVSEPTDKGRVYRIKDGKASSVAAERVKQAA